VGESEERDRDFINKKKRKEVADKTRRATESKIQLEDKVVLKNVIFPNKLTPNFDKVIQIDGSVVKISGGGKTYLRNISHKKISVGSQWCLTWNTATTATASRIDSRYLRGAAFRRSAELEAEAEKY